MVRLYKVFLVEDEIVARERIRNNIDWAAAGFELIGEAPDGEIALPLIQASRPDLLITDIKMPFMDGLQLSRIVRENMHDIKIIILSGHDEFNFAQEAIKIGVTEYLLKPFTSQDLITVLRKVAAQLDQEQLNLDNLRGLRTQAEDNLTAIQEKFLLKLILGNIATTEIVEKSRHLKLDLLARAYQVMVIKAEICSDVLNQVNYAELEKVEALIHRVIQERTGIILFRKDIEEMVFILKGESTTQLDQHSYLLSRLLKEEVESKIDCVLTIGIGLPKERIGDIARSFAEALDNTRQSGEISSSNQIPLVGEMELQRLDGIVIDQFLKTGIRADIDPFFDEHIGPLSQPLLNSQIFLHYFFIDLLITVSRFVDKLGGNPGEVLPQLVHPESFIRLIKTPEQLKDQTRLIILTALDFRDFFASNQYAGIIQKAQEYIRTHYVDADISLNAVAAQVNLSASHFSLLFGREVGETFVEYLTRIRIEKARELLRTTRLNANEISYEVGYNNPRYFYSVFKKVAGCSPTEFRLKAQSDSDHI